MYEFVILARSHWRRRTHEIPALALLLYLFSKGPHGIFNRNFDRIEEDLECLNRTLVHCSRKTAYSRQRRDSAQGLISKAAKITTESTNVRSKIPKGSGRISPASFIGSRSGIRFWNGMSPSLNGLSAGRSISRTTASTATL